MAEVFLAKDPSDPRDTRVVVKRILAHLAAHDHIQRMFDQEARIVARLQHPNVVRLIEVGEADGAPYLAMDYVAGVTLREAFLAARERGVRFPVAVVVDLIGQACEGVHAAHELADPTGRPAGLVHRDLSPHNLMVDATGRLVVLDFGIAKFAEDADQTRTGVLKGKLRYMSPEQCAQGPLDRRSDVFTLGIVAWELLTGERLFDMASDLAKMHAITQGQVKPIEQIRADVPAGVAAAVHDALTVDVAQRTRGADALRRALYAAAEDAGLEPDRATTAAFLRTLMGARLAERAPPTDDVTIAGPEVVDPPSPVGARVGLVAGVLGVALTLAAIAAAAIATVAFVGHLTRGPPGPPITITITPVLDTERMAHEFDTLAPWLGARLGHPVHFEAASSYEQAGELVQRGQVGFAVLTPYLYLETSQRAALTLVARELIEGSTGTDGLLVVPEASSVNRPADLVGKRLCVSDTRSATGYLLPRRWLREGGLDPDKDVVMVPCGNHHAALRSVVEGRCEAAGTYAGALLTADQAHIPASQIRTVAVTGRTPHDVIVAGPTTDPALVAAMREALLALDPARDLGVPTIGPSMRITGFAEAKEADFDDLRAAAEAEAAAERR